LLLEQLRYNALGLVEAYGFSDNSLRSALGRSDGKAYETLFDWVKNKNHINKPEVAMGIWNEFKPLMGRVGRGVPQIAPKL